MVNYSKRLHIFSNFLLVRQCTTCFFKGGKKERKKEKKNSCKLERSNEAYAKSRESQKVEVKNQKSRYARKSTFRNIKVSKRVNQSIDQSVTHSTRVCLELLIGAKKGKTNSYLS